VTWSNGTPDRHNVCIAAAGAASGCDEYRSGDPSTSWPSGGYSHAFAAARSYLYKCEWHPAMTGMITVQGVSSGTGTSAYPPVETQPTDTTTTQTETQQAPLDTTAPRFTGKLKRRSSRKAVILELGSSEDATVQATSFRRPPRVRSFKRISQATLKVKQGKNVVTVLRTSKGPLRRGTYRIKLQLIDGAGNESATKTFSFKLA
jgi:hypothetical protein